MKRRKDFIIKPALSQLYYFRVRPLHHSNSNIINCRWVFLSLSPSYWVFTSKVFGLRTDFETTSWSNFLRLSRPTNLTQFSNLPVLLQSILTTLGCVNLILNLASRVWEVVYKKQSRPHHRLPVLWTRYRLSVTTDLGHLPTLCAPHRYRVFVLPLCVSINHGSSSTRTVHSFYNLYKNRRIESLVRSRDTETTCSFHFC